MNEIQKGESLKAFIKRKVGAANVADSAATRPQVNVISNAKGRLSFEIKQAGKHLLTNQKRFRIFRE